MNENPSPQPDVAVVPKQTIIRKSVERRKKARQAAGMRAAGVSVPMIAQALKCSPRTVLRLLKAHYKREAEIRKQMDEAAYVETAEQIDSTIRAAHQVMVNTDAKDSDRLRAVMAKLAGVQAKKDLQASQPQQIAGVIAPVPFADCPRDPLSPAAEQERQTAILRLLFPGMSENEIFQKVHAQQIAKENAEAEERHRRLGRDVCDRTFLLAGVTPPSRPHGWYYSER